MSNCCANSASVLSPRTAAKATFALKAGVWFWRGRFVMVSPVRHTSWPLSGRNSTYPAVQISKASSLTLVRQPTLEFRAEAVRNFRDAIHDAFPGSATSGSLESHPNSSGQQPASGTDRWQAQQVGKRWKSVGLLCGRLLRGLSLTILQQSFVKR